MNLTLWWIKPLLIGLVVIGLAGTFEYWLRGERAAAAGVATASLQASYSKGVIDAKDKADAEFARKQAATEKSHAEDLARANARIADGLAARSELDRLRDRLRRPGPDAASAASQAGPVVDGSAVAYQLLGECSERYEAVAGDAGLLAAQVIGLQGFILANEIGSNSPVGERSRAGLIDLVTQPTTGSAVQSPVPSTSPITEVAS